jgi:hypothetical protein
MLANTGPLGATRQNDEGDAAHLQVLLVSDAPVGREQQPESRLFGRVQQRAVTEHERGLSIAQLGPVQNVEARQGAGRAIEARQNRLRSSLVKEMPAICSADISISAEIRGASCATASRAPGISAQVPAGKHSRKRRRLRASRCSSIAITNSEPAPGVK